MLSSPHNRDGRTASQTLKFPVLDVVEKGNPLMSSMLRPIMDFLRYVETWVWVWGIVSMSSVAVVAGRATGERLPNSTASARRPWS